MVIRVSASWCGIKDPKFASFLKNKFGEEFDTEKIKEIDCSSKNISDLSGIESFPNLEKLDCSMNELTSLNVRNNLKLKHLCCSGNQIKELNISMLSNLEELLCSVNQLENLDVSHNRNLKILYCSNNSPLRKLIVHKDMILNDLTVSEYSNIVQYA